MSRARHTTTDTGKMTRWTNGVHSLVMVRSLYGLPTIYLVVEKLENGNEVILSRHRLQTAGMTAMAKLAKETQ